MLPKKYTETIRQLKSAILASRYRAATLANKELLLLHFSVGKLISIKINEEKWGAKVLEQLAIDLQKELSGLRGFSSANLKKMRVFYEVWEPLFSIGSLVTNQLKPSKKKPVKAASIYTNNTFFIIGSSVTNQFAEAFFSIGFTHHYTILSKSKSFEERSFYIIGTAKEFWSVAVLENKIRSKYYKKQGRLLNNFSSSIPDNEMREKALQTFKDEYLLDFINIQDADLDDERLLENEVIKNIRKFILSIGTDFAFMGNQYRLVVEEKEFYVDLLFFNRKLQSLVAFELKKGAFKPEYLGKMNFYLSALDEMVKQSHENPSIGIILCKSKTDKVVEFSFRDFNKAMGVATYKTSKELPKKYKGILPDASELKKLLD